MTIPKKVAGKRFGRLLVKQVFKFCGTHKALCLCDCGEKTLVSPYTLNAGTTRSCGCLRRDVLREIKTTHGMSGRPELAVWKALIQRCTNPNDKDWLDYGGRGITVCDRWLIFENFYADMGDRPSDAHTIDRSSNMAGYSPGNCVWATWNQQALNRRPKGEGRKARQKALEAVHA